MLPAQRAQYLQALGIDAWVPLSSTPPRPLAAAPTAPPARPPGLVATPLAVAGTWDALRAEVASCRRCGLEAGRTQTVFGVGPTAADWLVIGEAPGAEEDARGEPFVGRAGGLLNAMLRGIGLARESVFIANVLKCRPPGNRDPSPREVAACLPYLQRQVELLKPRVILAVGRIAAQSLLASELPLGRLRGRVHTFGPQRIPLIVTYHPAYLLRTPSEKRKAWEDLKLARATASAGSCESDGHGA
jgi:DNA polymerase